MAKSRIPLDGSLILGDLDIFYAGDDGVSEAAPRRRPSPSARELKSIPDPTEGVDHRLNDEDNFPDF